MDARIQKLRGAARAAIAAQVQGLIKDPSPDPGPESGAGTVSPEHVQHHEWIARVHEGNEGFPSPPTPDTMLVNIMVGGRVAMSLRLPAGSPLPVAGEDVTVPWPFRVPGDDPATMHCRVTRRDFQLADGAAPAVALHVLPLI
jgi:hypothetical protein